MGKLGSGPRPLGLLSALLAFGLSAAMGVAFVIVVNKAHDLLSSDAFEESAEFQEHAVIGAWQGNWHDVPQFSVLNSEKPRFRDSESILDRDPAPCRPPA